MRPPRVVDLLSTAVLLFGTSAIGLAQAGYWQYVKTDTYIAPYPAGGAYPDTHSGSEGQFSVIITEPTVKPVPTLGATYYWSPPPSILIPNTAMYWPISATVDQNIQGRNLGISFAAMMYPYQPVSNLATASPWASTTYATLNTDSTMAVGTALHYNNALITSPAKIPAGTTTWMDSNGLMTILTWIQGSSTYYWSYVYKWIPGAQGSCGGTCTLASPGQSIGQTGGPGSVTVTASSTWDVKVIDSWITLTSPSTGTGNSTVAFTVAPNTGGPRTGTLIIGGQQYTISQTGSSTSSTQGGYGTVDLALNKTVTVSSQYPTISGSASSITNGKFTGSWFAYQGAPSYCAVIVDLGQVYSIGKIELNPLQVFDFQLYGSTDGTTYTKIASETYPVFTSMPTSEAINGAASARYIKFNGHTTWNAYVGLGALRVYQWLSTAPTPQPASAYGTTNLAKGKTVSNASGYTSDSSNPPSNVVDGNFSTAWYGTSGSYDKSNSIYDYYNTAGMVVVDLGQTYKLGKIVVTPAKAQVYGFYVTQDNVNSATSTNPVIFQFVSYPKQFATSNVTASAQTFYIDGSFSGRYIWLLAENETPGGTPIYPGVDEIEAYEFVGSGSSTGGANLITNGGAEAGPASGFGGAPSIPGWTSDGSVAVAAYSDSSGDLSASTVGPPNPGNNYFAGGSGNASSKMTQTIDLSSYASAIDAGTEPYTLDGWLGGYDGQDDNTVVQATFLNASGGTLGTASIGPVVTADRNGATELLDRTKSGTIPVGTRKVLITVTFTRLSGSDNDGLADNLSFTLTATVTTGNTIPIFGTGVQSAGTLATDASVDSHYKLTSSADSAYLGPNALVVNSSALPSASPYNWPANGPNSKWISPRSDAGTNAVGNYTYRTTFDLTGFDPTTAVLTGQYVSDDSAIIKLNGATVGPSSAGYQSWTTFTIKSGFIAGVNTLDFIVTNAAAATGVVNPTGLRVDISGTASTSGTSTCTYALGSTSQSAAATASSITVNVTAGSGCAWTAVSNVTWIAVSAGSTGTGNGAVTLQIAANTGSARTGTVTIAGSTFTVTQAASGTPGCSYSVNPTDVHATATGLSGTLLIVTNSTCTWTATMPSGIAWITLNPTSGTGSGAVGYSIAANTGAARNTSLTVAGVPVTVEEDAASTCTYVLGSTSDQVTGVGGSGAVTVTVTGSGCPAWNVSTPSVSWLHVTSATSQTATGMITYSVDPNPGAQRGTTLTIASQIYSITQAVAPCSYNVSASASPNIASSGGTGSVQLTVTGSVCAWAVIAPTDAASQWAHITSASNAAGSGSIIYAVDANPTTSSRSLVLTITGQKPTTQISYTVSQAAGTVNTGPVPVITPGGVVNAASFISANIPAGAIAQGSFFSIFGNGLGPAQYVQAQSYPLGTTLAGVSVKVTQGSTSVAAIPVFVAQYQINAVMPSNAPVGTVQVTVTYSGATSAPVQTQVAVNNFASFAVSAGRGPGIIQNFVSATQLPLNTATVTAAPGDVVILWGTGLGPLPNSASDTQPPAAGSLPVSVQVTVGGVSIPPLYSGRAPGLAGVDQINFSIPQSAPLGCYVPIQVVAAGMASNTVTMAIGTNRQPCTDPNPIGTNAKTGGNNGTVVLSRLTLTNAASASDTGTMDIGLAAFTQDASGGSLGFGLYASAPPRNTCTYYNNVNSLNALLVGQVPSGSSTNLDAGPSITITGPNGVRGLSYSDPSAKTAPYFGLLGANGALASTGLTSNPPFLSPGTYTVSGSGGKTVGPFSVPLNVTSGATWLNRDQISVIDRTAGLTINWSGGDPTSQVGMILGLASNPSTNVSGSFACLVTLDQSSFTVPPAMMANLPSTAGTNPGDMQSGLLFLTFPAGTQFVNFNTTAAPSLTNGMAMFISGDLRSNVTFK